MNLRQVLAVAVALAGTPAPLLGAQPAMPARADYRSDQRWLCLPGRIDICSTPLKTVTVGPRGYGAIGPSAIAVNAPVDCFYVYPTVSNDGGLNSDLNTGPEERSMVQQQFARFASVCRPFVPVYRQMTVASVAAYALGTDVTSAGMVAYGDIRDSFREYLRDRNGGRPFVLIGHSQGSLMLQRLIAQEIEPVPSLRRQLMLAILPGYNVLIPYGQRVGGTFRNIPVCNHGGETGCVLTWTSFRENNPPPPGALFGYSPRPGMTVACTNPARPGASQWVATDSYWRARSAVAAPGGPIRWSSEGAAPAPYVRTPGLVSVRCVNSGQRGYLSVHTNSNPQDQRTDRVGGEVSVFGMFLPGWGMHLADMDVALGDLVRQVGELSARSRTGAQPVR